VPLECDLKRWVRGLLNVLVNSQVLCGEEEQMVGSDEVGLDVDNRVPQDAPVTGQVIVTLERERWTGWSLRASMIVAHLLNGCSYSVHPPYLIHNCA
jgi:hypothetical protein